MATSQATRPSVLSGWVLSVGQSGALQVIFGRMAQATLEERELWAFLRLATTTGVKKPLQGLLRASLIWICNLIKAEYSTEEWEMSNRLQPKSAAWLDQVQEEIIDPERRIIDPHHHRGPNR